LALLPVIKPAYSMYAEIYAQFKSGIGSAV
jgi:hypothetical protein